MDIVKEAEKFAIEKHGDQMYGEKPYKYHLEQVAHYTRIYTEDPVAIAVAWLHDTIEDTGTTVDEVTEKFGLTIADAVFCLTDRPGKNRLERHLKTYGVIRTNPISHAVKLCDRLANMTESKGKDLAKMYAKEYISFKHALYSINPLHRDLWTVLDTLYDDLKKDLRWK